MHVGWYIWWWNTKTSQSCCTGVLKYKRGKVIGPREMFHSAEEWKVLVWESWGNILKHSQNWKRFEGQRENSSQGFTVIPVSRVKCFSLNMDRGLPLGSSGLRFATDECDQKHKVARNKGVFKRMW